MALHDYRQLVDLGSWGHVGVEVRQAGDVERIALDVSSLHLELDEGEAGALLDAIAGGLRILAAGDTPPATTVAVRADR